MERGSPLQGAWLENLHAWNEVWFHALQPVSLVSMRPWSRVQGSWVQVMKNPSWVPCQRHSKLTWGSGT